MGCRKRPKPERMPKERISKRQALIRTGRQALGAEAELFWAGFMG